MRIWQYVAAAAASTAWATASAQADAELGLMFDASQRLIYASNLYRLPDDADPARGSRSDLVSLTRLGASYSRLIGLQDVSVAVGVAATRYRESDHLDYEGLDVDGRWNWVVGRAWRGHLLARQSQSLSGFDDFAGDERSVNTYRRVEFVGDRAITPRWFVGAGASHTTSDYSDDTRPDADYRARGVSLRGGYQPRGGERVVVSVGRIRGEYPNRSASRFSDREYTQTDYRVSGSWAPTGITRFSGYLGYVTRSYDFADNRDYQGPVGRIEMAWQAGGKLRITGHARRELGAQEDLVDNYVVTEAVGVRPAWQVSDKVELASELEYRRRDFGGDPGFLSEPASDRRENQARLGLSAGYHYSRTLGFGASLRWESRNADSDARDYDATTASVTANLRF